MPTQRSIKRLLVVNRGEIAIRIIQACHELPEVPEIFALYTDSDTTHITLGRPQHAIKLTSPALYTNIDSIIKILKDNKIDAVHPGYGFLSENVEFSRRAWEEANVMVIGPGWEVLERTGDKLKAKALAEECQVPVLKAMNRATSSSDDVKRFAKSVGFPVMIKAVDGGGGRGIRLVENDDQLHNAVERCIGESPSKTVFAEQAAVEGFKHIEVQVIGDGKGGVKHLWERDCSVQRRFQKIVEVAPAPVKDRRTIARVIESALSMASKLKYLGLGTFEYLVNVEKSEFFFLEINPRVQVEHTISESIRGIDLVREQLLIAQGLPTDDKNLADVSQARDHPGAFSIQLRLCAEDPNSNFALSIGKVADVTIPCGNGVRVDSHLAKGGAVGSDFDNMMAKIIVTASTWEQTLAKARRALAETRISGVKTNVNLLRAIVANPEFCAGKADTTWLEKNLQSLIRNGESIGGRIESVTASLPELPTSSVQSQGVAQSAISLRKGDSWTLHLEGADKDGEQAHHLKIDRLVRNEFPDALVANISFTIPGQKPLSFKATVASTTSSANATASTHRRGDTNNPDHIVLPMSGKLIEVLVDEGDEVKENDIVAFVKQMKMELEVRSPKSGIVDWVIELENDEGDDVAEGVLLVQLRQQELATPSLRSKL